MPSPISPPPLRQSRPEILPAYLSNGVIGLRVRHIPLNNGIAVLNGYSGEDPVTRVESATYAPYPLGGDLRLGQTWLSQFPEAAHFEEQAYDFAAGELTTRFTVMLEGMRARVRVLTFCSRTLPTLVLQEVSVELDDACDLALRASVDPTGIPGQWLARTVRTPGTRKAVVDGSLRWESLGGMSSCGAAYKTDLLGAEGADEVQRELAEWHEQGPLVTTYSLHAEARHRYILRQIASMVPSTLHHAPDHEAVRLAWFGHDRGFERLRAENRAAWAELWRGRIHLRGAEERWQAMADAAYYYLHASVHPSSPSSTSPFGLAEWYNYSYFYGHIMWELATFTLPPLLLTYPQAARAMLDYRAQRLPAARSNAKLFGFLGAQFPWQSSMTHGEECTPLEDPSSAYEQHVTLDVAFAFAQYGYATDDTIFQREAVWPVLREAAEWVESRVTKTARGYETFHITGPAEPKGPVNNNAYFNMAATVVLRAACEWAERMGYAPPPAWERIARGLVIPKDAKTHAILNYDGYSPEEKGGATPSAAAGFFPLGFQADAATERATPSAAAGFFPLGFQADAATERATLEYYLKLAPRYLGIPMLSTLFGVFAARLGDRTCALEMLEKGYAQFIQEPFSTPTQQPPSTYPHDGPFFANLGGFLMDCLYGLPGLQLSAGSPESWCTRPVVLPEGWESIEVDRVWVRGQPARLLARQGAERARIEVSEGGE